MFGCIKKVIVAAMTFFSCNALECVLMTNQECKIRPQVVNINSDSPFFHTYSFQVNNCSGSCNNIDDPYQNYSFLMLFKKVFNLVLRTNERRHKEWHETCKCKCRLDANVCNYKKYWNQDKCRCECKGLIDKDRCEKGFVILVILNVNLINRVMLENI